MLCENRKHIQFKITRITPSQLQEKVVSVDLFNRDLSQTPTRLFLKVDNMEGNNYSNKI